MDAEFGRDLRVMEWSAAALCGHLHPPDRQIDGALALGGAAAPDSRLPVGEAARAKS